MSYEAQTGMNSVNCAYSQPGTNGGRPIYIDPCHGQPGPDRLGLRSDGNQVAHRDRHYDPIVVPAGHFAVPIEWSQVHLLTISSD